MRRYAIAFLLTATSTLALSGCKSKQQKFAELRQKYTAAMQVYAQDCPTDYSNDVGKPDSSPKCNEEDEHIQELQKQVVDAQRDLAK
jgi:hypothetical protein